MTVRMELPAHSTSQMLAADCAPPARLRATWSLRRSWCSRFSAALVGTPTGRERIADASAQRAGRGDRAVDRQAAPIQNRRSGTAEPILEPHVIELDLMSQLRNW
jgi:hypothetical protein